MRLKPGRRYEMSVSFAVHEEVELADVKEWLESGGGCRHPEDPLFSSLSGVRTALSRRKK